MHHVGRGKGAPVFAYTADIEEWRLERRATGVQAYQGPALRSENRRLRSKTQLLLVTLRRRMAEMTKTLEAGQKLYEAHHRFSELTTNHHVTHRPAVAANAFSVLRK